MAEKEQLSREEAIKKLTMRRDQFEDAKKEGDFNMAMDFLGYAGDEVGYTPAFRCIVKGLDPEQAIRWGK